MADFEMVFILTDSAQRYFDPDNKKAVEVVKLTNIPTDKMDEYVPFGLFFMVSKTCELNGLNVKGISGSSNSVTIEGFTKRGILPIPVTETFTIGDSYTADGMFSISADSSSQSQGSVAITEIICCKNKDDLEGIFNAMQKAGQKFGRKIQYAENEMPEGIMMKAESEDIDEDGYDAFMAEIGMNAYPQQRDYQSNV